MRKVLVTGSTRGIGVGIAGAFAAQGYSVVECSRTTTGDVSDPAICAAIVERHGFFDVLVNNAGAALYGLLQDATPQEISETLNANLLTAIHMSRAVLPAMISRKRGVIINITSTHGITGAACEAVYSAAKAGVIGFTKSLAKELAPSGIRVNAIAPGIFDTRMLEHFSEEEKNALRESVPMGRFGEPHEVGDLAVFLASERASYITGQVIAVDGGLV
jgi:3-oxoacyl-[acyl-carrier protein] reductase